MQSIVQYMLLVTGRVPEMGFSGIRNQLKNGSNGKLNKAFLTAFAKMLAYLMICQSFTVPSMRSTLKNHQICQNFDK